MSETPELPPLPGRVCDCKHPQTISVDPRTHGGYPFQCKVCGVNFSHHALPAELPPLSPHISPGERIAEAAFQAWGRECWEAGRRAGLEEAAKLCEMINHGGFGPQSYLSGLEDGSRGCANVIRAACGGTGRAKP